MNWLFDKDLITNPVGTAKSVSLTEAGMEWAQRLAKELFGKD